MQTEREGVCRKHGLATRPDGTCVRCRTEEQDTSSRKVVWGVFGGFVVMLLVLGGYWWLRDQKRESIVAPLAEATVAPGAVASTVPVAAPPVEAEEAERAKDPWAGMGMSDGGADASDAADESDASDASDAKAERERQIEAASKKVSVTIYYSPSCSACQSALAYMQVERIAHRALNIDADESAARRRRFLTSSQSIPTIDVEGTILTGFSPESLKGAIRAAAEKRVDQGRY